MSLRPNEQAELDNVLQQIYSEPPKKLTKWRKEPSLIELKEIFTEAQGFQQTEVAKIQDWRDLADASGKYSPKQRKGRSQVQPKLIRKQAEWRYSALSEPFLGSEKLFQVNPTTFEDETASSQNELLLNWQFRTKIDKVKFIDDYVRSAVDEGTVICRTGWEYQSRMDEVNKPIFEYQVIEEPEGLEEHLQAAQEEGIEPPPEVQQYMQVVQQVQEMYEFSKANPRFFKEQVQEEFQEAVRVFEETGEVVQAQIVGTEVVEEETILINQPTVDVLDPEDVYIDPTCKGRMDDALFVIYTFQTSQHELMKEEGRYQNLDAIVWESQAVGKEGLGLNDHFKFKDSMKTKVTAYEYWGYHDINDDGIMVPIVATWVGNVLIRLEESPFPDGRLPFVVVPYLPVKRKLYGEPDAEQLREHQMLVGAITRSMVDTMGRSATGQTAMPIGWLDPINERRFQNNMDYFYNPTNGMHPSQAVFTHTPPELPRSTFDMLSMQLNEAESMTGVKAFSGGISGSAYGDVAAGIRGALDATSKREMAILRRLAKGVIEIGERIIAMNAEFLSEEEVVRVTNREYVTIKREDLKGNFDLIVDISTAEVDDAKAEDLAFMAQTIGPIAGPEASMQIFAEIADLKRMPDVAERFRTWKQEPDPVQQQLAELEVQLKQMEIQKMQAEIQKLMAEAGSKQADTDLSMSGETHRRDMEKQKAQSQGNQHLKITDALAKSNEIEAAIGYAKLSEMSGHGNEPVVDNQHSVAPVNNNEFIGR